LLVEYFGAFLLAVLSLPVYAAVGFVLALRLPRHPVELITTVGATVQPTHASLWLRGTH